MKKGEKRKYLPERQKITGFKPKYYNWLQLLRNGTEWRLFHLTLKNQLFKTVKKILKFVNLLKNQNKVMITKENSLYILEGRDISKWLQLITFILDQLINVHLCVCCLIFVCKFTSSFSYRILIHSSQGGKLRKPTAFLPCVWWFLIFLFFQNCFAGALHEKLWWYFLLFYYTTPYLHGSQWPGYD